MRIRSLSAAGVVTHLAWAPPARRPTQQLEPRQVAPSGLFSYRAAAHMPKRRRHDWSKPLPLPLVIPELMALQTLADVQTLMRHLPEDRRERSTWRHVAAQLEAATLKGDTKDVAIALRMVLTLEGIEWHPKSGRAASPPPWSVEGHQLVSQIVNTIGCRNFDNQLYQFTG
jgi:hypothetical protein